MIILLDKKHRKRYQISFHSIDVQKSCNKKLCPNYHKQLLLRPIHMFYIVNILAFLVKKERGRKCGLISLKIQKIIRIYTVWVSLLHIDFICCYTHLLFPSVDLLLANYCCSRPVEQRFQVERNINRNINLLCTNTLKFIGMM